MQNKFLSIVVLSSIASCVLAQGVAPQAAAASPGGMPPANQIAAPVGAGGIQSGGSLGDGSLLKSGNSTRTPIANIQIQASSAAGAAAKERMKQVAEPLRKTGKSDKMAELQEEIALLKLQSQAADARATMYAKEADAWAAKKKGASEKNGYEQEVRKPQKASTTQQEPSVPWFDIERDAVLLSVEGFDDHLTAEVMAYGGENSVSLTVGQVWRGFKVVAISSSKITFDQMGRKFNVGLMAPQTVSNRLAYSRNRQQSPQLQNVNQAPSGLLNAPLPPMIK